MSTDRFVEFHGRTPPTRDDVRMVLEDFVGDGGKVRWEEDQTRFYITLFGACTEPLRRVSDVAAQRHEDDAVPPPPPPPRPWPRWIEVYLSADNIDVITRMQDDFTHAVASGIVDCLVRGFDGTRGLTTTRGERTP